MVTKSIWGIFANVVCIALGIFFYYTGLHSLPKAASFIGLGMLIGGACYFYASQTMTPDNETILTSAKGYLLLTSLAGMFNLCKELAFFGIERRHRFTAKSAADFTAYALAPSIAAYTAMMTLNYGPLGEHTHLYAALFAAAMVAYFAGFYWINRELKDRLPDLQQAVSPQ
ncbi:MAG: hypothetical protein WB791_01800 [Waddliaceae bacterium]